MIVELIERMEKFLLRALLARYDVNVVDQQNIGGTIVPVEKRHAVQFDRRNHLVHKPFARCINHVQAAETIQQTAADSVHQMSFSDTHSAVNEQWIVASRRH